MACDAIELSSYAQTAICEPKPKGHQTAIKFVPSALIEAFQRLPPPTPLRPTFMELSGYPHYENVCSNVLAFFLDPSSPHGLGTLCLDALLEASEVSANNTPLSNVQVDREMAAGSGRLDILISSDSMVIAVENKLFASLNNPLDDYPRSVEEFAQQRKIVKLVLSLGYSPSSLDHGFRRLSYKTFFGALRAKPGDYLRRADARYILYLTDFLNTIDDLQRGTQMENAWLDFSRDHPAPIEKLLKQVVEFKCELRSKVQELQSTMDTHQIPNVKK